MLYDLPTIKSCEFIEFVFDLVDAFVHIHQIEDHRLVFDDVCVASFLNNSLCGSVENFEYWFAVEVLPDVIPILRFFRRLILVSNLLHLIVLYRMRVNVGSEVRILKTAYAVVAMIPSDNPMDTEFSKPFGESGIIVGRNVI